VEEDESPKERVDRELDEMLSEVRVALPGVGILFAFLLTLPFTDRFLDLDATQRRVYFASFLCAAGAIALLISPSAYHRLRFRDGEKEQMLFTSTRLMVAGLGLTALAIAGSVFVITDLLFQTVAGSLVAAATAAWFAWFWFGLPVSRRVEDGE
jgi:hypothetical protein